MNKSELLHYKNPFLAKQQELATSKSLVGSIPAVGEAYVAPEPAV